MNVPSGAFKCLKAATKIIHIKETKVVSSANLSKQLIAFKFLKIILTVLLSQPVLLTFIFQILLIDSRRSMNVNIFLKQFKMSNQELVEHIKLSHHEKIGQEKLLGLLKIMPQTDEVEVIKSFGGDRTKLGNAEKFYDELIGLTGWYMQFKLSKVGVISYRIQTNMHDFKSKNTTLAELWT